MGWSPFPMEKKRLAGLVSVLTFGLTSLFAVLALEALVPATFVLGFFLVLPLIGVLGEDLPIVKGESENAAAPEEADEDRDPVERLRERYADGEISDAEFERRLERLLETEDLDRLLDSDRARTPGATRRAERPREPETE